jgi:hypothetical protein
MIVLCKAGFMIIDLLCDDYERAKLNRKMIKLKRNIAGYIFIETMVRNWPHKKPFPEWLWGVLPTINKQESREFKNNGMHVIDDDYINNPRYYRLRNGFAISLNENKY